MGKLGVCKTPFNYDPTEYPGTDFTPQTNSPDDPSLSRTAQEYKDESDPNVIIKNYTKNGAISETILNKREAIYGDVSEVGSYFEAECKIARVKEAFMTLDADTREMFNNDPGQMLDFLANPLNEKEAIELGLLPQKKVSEAPAEETPTAPAVEASPDAKSDAKADAKTAEKGGQNV